MTDLYIKSILAFLVLIFFLIFLLKFLERRRIFLKGIEGVKIVPITSEDRLIVFSYEGTRFIIFSSSTSTILLDKKPVEGQGNIGEKR